MGIGYIIYITYRDYVGYDDCRTEAGVVPLTRLDGTHRTPLFRDPRRAIFGLESVLSRTIHRQLFRNVEDLWQELAVFRYSGEGNYL